MLQKLSEKKIHNRIEAEGFVKRTIIVIHNFFGHFLKRINKINTKKIQTTLKL